MGRVPDAGQRLGGRPLPGGVLDPTIVVITRIWPTSERPSLGSYVRDRVRGVAGLRVVRPSRRHLPRPLIYVRLLLEALAMPGPVRGVEAHMVVPTGAVGLVVARLRGVPLVVYAHGGDVRNWRRRPALVRWLMRLVVRRAEGLVTNSDDTAHHLRELGGTPIIAPPGVDLTRFRPTPRPARRRVLYLGGRDRNKGYDVAVELADTLIGPRLRDVEPDRVPGLMAEHDVVLVPSVSEGFGLAAAEAIASGRWVVASNVGGLREIVIDGVNGSLVADGDFAGALARVPDYDPHVVASTAARFGLDRSQAALAKIWDEVLSERA